MLTPSSRMRNGLAEDVLNKKMLLLMMVRDALAYCIVSMLLFCVTYARAFFDCMTYVVMLIHKLYVIPGL